MAVVVCQIAATVLSAQGVDASPPAQTVKLVFIHHSCGENWLDDGNGGLGRALGDNNYFVSDTNYGWGPDGIGDRTDITDWPEWFTGPESGRYLAALFSEGAQLSNYTRPLPDPGGENQVVLFKSCFPNSNLEGSPADGPARGEGLTVGNAKAIYNELLATFATRPDKLFVAITAPPVQDPTYADNARAFNHWLATEWLAGYPDSNVAVWDFYNVLTDPDNHHRVHAGGVEYVTERGSNTLHYPTDGDDHPSSKGNRKAADEFVPMLNVFYHRWQSGEAAAPPPPAPAQLPATSEPTAEPEPTAAGATGAQPPEPPPSPGELGGMLLDFEAESGDWTVFTDGETPTELTCARDGGETYSGAGALGIEYDIAAEGWAICALVYGEPADWRRQAGLAFYLRSGEAGVPLTLIAYGGTASDALKPFHYCVTTNQEAVAGWQRVDVAWDAFREPEWEGDGTARFDPAQALGLGFSFDPGSSGWLRVDDISFLSSAPGSISPAPVEQEPPASAAEPTQAPAEPAAAEPESETETGRGGGLCGGSAALGLLALTSAIWPGVRRRGRI